MELYLLNKKFRKIAAVEGFDSEIWSLRYAEYGDFEIHTYYFSKLTSDIMKAAYVYDEDTKTAMFIEDVEITTDSDDAPMAVFKGRSLESILERRIIWRPKKLKGRIQTIISHLISENIIDPVDTNGDPDTVRRISNFVFKASSDTRLNEFKIDEHSPIEVHGDNLYDIVKYLCDLFDVGFRVTLDVDAGNFIFEMYYGRVLDGSVSAKRKISFSPKMDNLSNTRYYSSSENYKNVTRIESTYELKAEQDGIDDPPYAAEQTNDSSSAIIASVTSETPLPGTLTPGLRVNVQLHKSPSAGATLNIGGTGAKPIYYNNAPIPNDKIGSGSKIMTYCNVNGTNVWMAEYESFAITAHTPSWVVFPRGSEPLTDGLRVLMQFHKKVSAGATLSINGTSPKWIYYKDKAIRDDVIDGSATVILTYSDHDQGKWVIDTLEDTDQTVEQSRVLVYPENQPSGLNRREIFTDASNIETEDGMTPDNYAESMRVMGYTTLRENCQTTDVDGESIPNIGYIYGKDYTLGDIVHVENECGISLSARITEYVQTFDENGPSACPTFSTVYS